MSILKNIIVVTLITGSATIAILIVFDKPELPVTAKIELPAPSPVAMNNNVATLGNSAPEIRPEATVVELAKSIAEELLGANPDGLQVINGITFS